MVNSMHDPTTDEVAAFEELVGSHGGLGGNQSIPFLLYPAEFELDDKKLVGAASVHSILKVWLRQLGHNVVPDQI